MFKLLVLLTFQEKAIIIFFAGFNRPRLNQNVSVQATSREPAMVFNYIRKSYCRRQPDKI